MNGILYVDTDAGLKCAEDQSSFPVGVNYYTLY